MIDGKHFVCDNRIVVARQGHGEPEGGANTFSTIKTNLAAHHFTKLLGDGESQPRAAIFARGSGIGLREFLEQFRLRFLGNTNAGIFDRHLNHRLVFVFDVAGNLLHSQQHTTFLGEFDGIADEVGDELADTRRVADQIGGRARHKAQDQLDCFLTRLDCHEFRSLVDHGLQIERNIF